MVLDVCGDRRIEGPTDEEIRWAVLELDTGNDDAFLILSAAETSYVQCAGDRNVGFDLEYQEGGMEHHYRAVGGSVAAETVIAVLCKFRAGAPGWKGLVGWERMKW